MNERTRRAAGAADRGDGADGARMKKARRNAWLLGGLAVLFYAAYMAWTYFRSSGG